MAKRKARETYDSYEEDYVEEPAQEMPEDEEEFDPTFNPEEPVGESFTDKAILDLLLDTEIILKNLQRNMEGKEEINGEFVQVRLPIARDEIIAFVINSLRSIINPSNSFSYIGEDEAKMSRYEKILEFEYMAVEEFTIDNKDFETLINMCDHALELFYGKVIEGHLTTALQGILTGTNPQIDHKKEPESLFTLNKLMGK